MQKAHFQSSNAVFLSSSLLGLPRSSAHTPRRANKNTNQRNDVAEKSSSSPPKKKVREQASMRRREGDPCKVAAARSYAFLLLLPLPSSFWKRRKKAV